MDVENKFWFFQSRATFIENYINDTDKKVEMKLRGLIQRDANQESTK